MTIMYMVLCFELPVSIQALPIILFFFFCTVCACLCGSMTVRAGGGIGEGVNTIHP